jgi:hypothetical protein
MYSKVKSTLESIKTWAMEHKVGCVTATQPHRPCTREMTPEEREELARRPICIDYIGVIGTP